MCHYKVYNSLQSRVVRVARLRVRVCKLKNTPGIQCVCFSQEFARADTAITARRCFFTRVNHVAR